MSNNKSPMILYYVVGQRIRMIREKLGLSQQNLSDQMGLTRVSVSQMESGKTRIQLEHIYTLADALHCKPCDLLPEPSERLTRTLEDAFAEWLEHGGPMLGNE